MPQKRKECLRAAGGRNDERYRIRREGVIDERDSGLVFSKGSSLPLSGDGRGWRRVSS